MSEAKDPLLDKIEREGQPEDLPKIPAPGSDLPQPDEEEEDTDA